MFKLSFSSTILRFYLMMLIAILAIYTHQSWLIVVAFAIGVTAILGYRIDWFVREANDKIVQMKPTKNIANRKAS